MKCISCGCELPEDSLFCVKCGSKQQQNKICPSCHAELPLDALFCFKCGCKLSGDSSSYSGMRIGDKNVIAGDVIGKKEEYKVSGNATFIKNEDETKKVVRCHVCFKNIAIVNTHTCPICGEAVCDNCFDVSSSMCISCRSNSKVSKENEYKEALKKAYEDGKVSLSERKTLEVFQQRLGITDEKANELENEIRLCGNKSSNSFTTVEKLNMEDASYLFYEKGDVDKAYNLMKDIYKDHPDDEKVLELYIPLLAEYDRDEALRIIDNLKADMLSAYLAQIDIYTKSDLSKAEKVLDNAEKLWIDNLLVKCRRINWLYKMYLNTHNDSFCEKINEIVSSLPECNNRIENTWKARVENISEANGNSLSFITKEECEEKDIYFGYSNCSLFIVPPKEVTVDIKGNGDFKSIQDAINYVNEDSVIYINSGTYNEAININKKLTIIGDENNKPLVCIDIGTICKINSDVTLKNIHFRNLELKEKENSEYGAIELYSNCTIENCETSDSFDCGLLIKGDNITPHILNCSFHNSMRNGISIESSSTPIVEGCRLYENKNNGLSIIGSSNPTILHCDIYGNNANCILVLDEANPIVENSILHNQEGDAINIGGKATGTYTKCKIYNISKYACIYADESTNPTVDSCEIYDNEDEGIVLDGNATGTIINCDIHHNNSSCLEVYEKANPKVDNCIFHDQEGNAIKIKGNAKGSYTNCKIYNITKYASIFVGERANPTLDNCEIYDNESKGIWIEDNATGSYLNCDIYGNKETCIGAIGDANPTVENCNFHDMEGKGLFILGHSKGNYSNCNIYNLTSYAAIYVGDYANPTVDNCEIYDNESKGIWVQENATGTYLNCDIHNNKEACIGVYGDANPTVENCNLHDMEGNGLNVKGNAKGTYSNCKIYNMTKYPNIFVGDTANPIINNC